MTNWIKWINIFLVRCPTDLIERGMWPTNGIPENAYKLGETLRSYEKRTNVNYRNSDDVKRISFSPGAVLRIDSPEGATRENGDFICKALFSGSGLPERMACPSFGGLTNGSYRLPDNAIDLLRRYHNEHRAEGMSWERALFLIPELAPLVAARAWETVGTLNKQLASVGTTNHLTLLVFTNAERIAAVLAQHQYHGDLKKAATQVPGFCQAVHLLACIDSRYGYHPENIHVLRKFIA